MRQHSVTSFDVPASPETTATVTFVLIVLAMLIVFMTPHYFTTSIFGSPTLQIGTWGDSEPAKSEPWQVGDYGQLRHLRYANGSTCTQIITGPLVTQVCR